MTIHTPRVWITAAAVFLLLVCCSCSSARTKSGESFHSYTEYTHSDFVSTESDLLQDPSIQVDLRYGEVCLLSRTVSGQEQKEYAISVGKTLLYGFDTGISRMEPVEYGHLLVYAKDHMALLNAKGEAVLPLEETRVITCWPEWIITESDRKQSGIYQISLQGLSKVWEQEGHITGIIRCGQVTQFTGDAGTVLLNQTNGSLIAQYPPVSADDWALAREAARTAIQDFYQTLRSCSGPHDPQLLRLLPPGAEQYLTGWNHSETQKPETLHGYPLLAWLIEHRTELYEHGGSNLDDWEEQGVCAQPSGLSAAILYYGFTKYGELETPFILTAREDGTYELSYFAGDLCLS